MLSLSVWTWIGIAAWVVFVVVLAIGVALSLCRMSAAADRAAEDMHRQASRAHARPPKEAA